MKKFVAYILSIILIFPCLILFSACEGDKVLDKIAFYSGENKIVANATFSYNYGEEVDILGSSLSVKAIYTDNTTKTLSANEFSYEISVSASGNFNDAISTNSLPTSTSTGHYRIVANYKNCSATIYINIGEAETKYFATINKLGDTTIYFGDKANLFNLGLSTGDSTADTTNFLNLTYYVVSESELALVPSSETNKAQYILETNGINYSLAREIENLNIGSYYIFASLEQNSKTIYSDITSASKFTICQKPIPVAEPIFDKTTFNGNSHTLTINNMEFYSVVSGNLINTNAGTYTVVIKPKFSENYAIDWNNNFYNESDYAYYTNFENFSADATTGGITDLAANKTTGEISITYQIEKASLTEGVKLGEFFDMRAGSVINTSIIPYSFNSEFVYFRAALYSEVNKNVFLNSYTNTTFKISLLNNTANAVLIKNNLNNGGFSEIEADVTNSIFIAVPLENYFDGMTLNYKIAINETVNYNAAEFSGELTLNNISANFTSPNIAVSAGTTLGDITSLFSNLDGVKFTWYNVDELNNDLQQDEVDPATEITENIKYALFATIADEAWENEQIIEVLEQILTENEVVFNFEVYAQDNRLLNNYTYTYQNNSKSYKLSKFGKNIVYVASSGESRFYKFVENAANLNLGYYEVYLASENGTPTNNKVGIVTQGQLSNIISLFLTEFNLNNGETSATV